MSTGDWDLFLGPLEWARAETGGADEWVLQRRGFPGVVRIYSPPCPWDTHYQFSIKTLLSNTSPTTPHPTSPHYPYTVTSQNLEPNIIVFSPNIVYPSPHSLTRNSPRHAPVQCDTCPCPSSPGPTLPPLTRGTDTDDRKISFFFFPVQSRGTEPSAAVQGGHFLCR